MDTAAIGLTGGFLQENLTTHPNTTTLSQQTEALNNQGCIELPAASINPCDNSDGLVSMATRQVVEDIFFVVLLPILMVVGTVTNVINMAIFFAQGLGDRVHLCLFSLSLADLLALVSLSVINLRKILIYLINPSWGFDVWETALIRYRLINIAAGFQLVTNFISIVIAVDRWFCVSWPLRVARALSTRKTCVVIIVFSVLVFAGVQFTAFKYDVACAYRQGAERITFLYVVPSKLYQMNPVLMETLDAFVFISLVPTLSVLITATATIFTVIKLRRAAMWRRDSSTQGGSNDVVNQKEKALTNMLVVISCVFVVCASPRVVRAWCRFFIPEFRAWGKWCGLMLTTQTISDAMLAVNSTVNFFVYYSMGSRFRSTLSQLMMTRCRCRPLEK